MSESVRVSLKVPREDVEALMAISKTTDRTLSAEVRIAIREHIQLVKENGNGNA